MDTSSEKKFQEEYIKKVKKINQDKNLKYTILTMGCQLNENDSEKLLGGRGMIGYEEVETEDADFLIFNTCTVRENANTKLYGHLGQVKKMKDRNPQMMIGLCGCMMQ